MAAAPNDGGFAFLAALLDGESPEALPQLTMPVLSHDLLGAAEFPQTETNWTAVFVSGQGRLPLYTLGSDGCWARRQERVDNAIDYR